MNKTPRRALTLIETLVVCAILAVVMVVLGEMIQWGLKAHRKGEAARQATTFGREILGHLTSEIATADTLPPYNTTGPASSGSPIVATDFQSAVLWPSCFNNATVQLTSPQSSNPNFYLEEPINITLPSGTVVPADRGHNRVIFSRPGIKPGPGFNDADYSQYVYVEYVVAPADSNGLGQNILYRRLYSVAVTGGDPRGVNLLAWPRTVNDIFFKMDTDPLSNPNLLVASIPGAQRLEQCIIYQLPNPTDQITFTVDHTLYVSNTGQQAPWVAYWDPSLFTINVNINIDQQGGYLSNQNFLANQTLSGQVRVKSGN